ncbi:methionine adenosyltransferase domain-containing protein [Patescibacteria group bacterium]|nr:methionine adenosyltransferase domain-containing protein [Patescibacteria group bacterium]
MWKVVEAPLSGHPDKVCDLIVESVVDEYLRRDPMSKMDIQALGANGMVVVGGAVESKADFDVTEIARRAYASVGYSDEVEFFVNVEKPREEPSRDVKSRGAQGTAIVYGYATRETREMLPRSVVYAQALARRIDELRQGDERFSWLRPDGKVQLAMEGDRIVHAAIIAAHTQEVDAAQVQALLFDHAVTPVLGPCEGVKVFVNPVGGFTTGGFCMNAGVSGRKVLADMYGGLLPHGGMALAGKDPVKPTRAGTYMARFAARAAVQEGLANNVLINAVYTVGLAEPVYLVARGGDGTDVTAWVQEHFDFRPEAIVERLNLRRPMYARASEYGMFGKEGVPWEE